MQKSGFIVLYAVGISMFFYAMFDGIAYQQRGMPVQWIDVNGLALGVYFLWLGSVLRVRELKSEIVREPQGENE